MAATYTEITLDEIRQFLERGFRVLRPKEGVKGEVYYDLSLSPNVLVRVYTSIAKGHNQAAGVGKDAIRVVMLSKAGKALQGKQTIVKRTQNWRNSLQSRIEDLIESYEDREDYFESRAQGHATPAAPPKPVPTRDPRGEWEATFTKLPGGGGWGLRILGPAQPGDKVKAVRRDGRAQHLTVGEVVWKGRDRGTGEFVSVTTIGNTRNASKEEEESQTQDQEEPQEDTTTASTEAQEDFQWDTFDPPF